jgi:hypothetical protein
MKNNRLLKTIAKSVVIIPVLFLMSCSFFFGRNASGDEGTVTLNLGGGSARYLGAPKEWLLEFSFLTATVRQGSKQIGQYSVAAASPSFNVPYGSGYTLEVSAAVAPGSNGFAKSYAGVSDLFNVDSPSVSIPVQIRLDTTVPVEIGYDEDIYNYYLFDDDADTGLLWGSSNPPFIDFDKYGRLIVSGNMDGSNIGIYFFDNYSREGITDSFSLADDFDEPPSITYDAYGDYVFFNDALDYTGSPVNVYGISLKGDTLQAQLFTVDPPINNLLNSQVMAAADGKGYIYIEYFDESYDPIIKKYEVNYNSYVLTEITGFSIPLDSDCYFPDMKIINGKHLVLAGYDSDVQGLIIYDLENDAALPLPKKIPLGDDALRITGWDHNGVYVYGENIDTLYVPFNGNINASFDFTINFETDYSPDDSFRFRFSLYDGNLYPSLRAIEGTPEFSDISDLYKSPFYWVGYYYEYPNFIELSPCYDPIFSNPITKKPENPITYTVHFEAVEPKKYVILIEIYNEAGSDYYNPEKHYVYLASSSDAITPLPGKTNSGAINMGSGQRYWEAYSPQWADFNAGVLSSPPFISSPEADF